MLTLAQALEVFLRQPDPPWDTRSVPGDRSTGVSLLSFVKSIGDQRVLAFVEVRPTSLLDGVSTIQDLRSKWNSAKPDKATLLALSTVIEKTGGSIVYRSKDDSVIGIRGSISSLSGVGTLPLSEKSDPNKDVRDAQSTIGQGAGAAGAGIVALAGAAAASALPPAISTIIVIGSFGVVFPAAGLVLGAGIAALLAVLAQQSASKAKQPEANPLGGGAASPLTGFDTVGLVPDHLDREVLDALLKAEFGIDTEIPEPGQLPGGGDIIPGGDGFPGDFPV